MEVMVLSFRLCRESEKTLTGKREDKERQEELIGNKGWKQC